MQRRDALKLIATGAVLPALTPDLFAFFREAHPAPGYVLRTLNPHQNATVTLMADLIIPETDTPGAKAVRVNEFIDLILTEWASDEERKKFLDGLADVDRKSNELFGKTLSSALSPSKRISSGIWTKPRPSSGMRGICISALATKERAPWITASSNLSSV